MRAYLIAFFLLLWGLAIGQSLQQPLVGFKVDVSGYNRLSDTTYRIFISRIYTTSGATSGLDIEIGHFFYSRPWRLDDDCNRYEIINIPYMYKFSGAIDILDSDQQGRPMTGFNAVIEESSIGEPMYIEGLSPSLAACISSRNTYLEGGYNEKMWLSTDTLFLKDDNDTVFTVLPSGFVDKDESGRNRAFYLNNDTLFITDDSSTLAVSLFDYIDNTDTSGYNRQFSLSEDTLYITDDNSTLSVVLSGLSSTIDSIYFSNDTLFITSGDDTYYGRTGITEYVTNNTLNQISNNTFITVSGDTAYYNILVDSVLQTLFYVTIDDFTNVGETYTASEGVWLDSLDFQLGQRDSLDTAYVTIDRWLNMGDGNPSLIFNNSLNTTTATDTVFFPVKLYVNTTVDPSTPIGEVAMNNDYVSTGIKLALNYLYQGIRYKREGSITYKVVKNVSESSVQAIVIDPGKYYNKSGVVVLEQPLSQPNLYGFDRTGTVEGVMVRDSFGIIREISYDVLNANIVPQKAIYIRDTFTYSVPLGYNIVQMYTVAEGISGVAEFTIPENPTGAFFNIKYNSVEGTKIRFILRNNSALNREIGIENSGWGTLDSTTTVIVPSQDIVTFDAYLRDTLWIIDSLYLFKKDYFSMPFDSVTFTNNSSTVTQGELQFDDEQGFLKYGGIDDVELKVNKDDVWLVKNETGEDIPKGKLLMVVGTDGNSGHLLVDYMQASNLQAQEYVLGVSMHTILNDTFGYVMSKGILKGVNLSGYSDSTILWADPFNPGDFTTEAPQSGALKLPVAFVVSNKNNGVMAVRVKTGESLHQLHDVKFMNLQPNQILKYRMGWWVNDVDSALTEGQVKDYVGEMVVDSLNERIQVTYDPATKTFSFVVDPDLSNYSNTNSMFLTSEIDGDVTNELQDLSLSGNTLNLTNDATPVDLSGYLDNTDDQIVDQFEILSNTLYLSLEDDGQAASTVNLSPYLDNTDNQDLSLAGNTLSITGDATPVDLSSYLDNTDDQTIDSLYLSGNILNISLEDDNQPKNSVDLTPILNTIQQPTVGVTEVAFGDTDGTLTSSSNLTWNGNTLKVNNASSSVLIGRDAGLNVTGLYNAALGRNALYSTTSGSDNMAIGLSAMYYSQTTQRNVVVGNAGLFFLGSGDDNVAIGNRSLQFAGNYTTGFTAQQNVGIGSNAGRYTNSSYNATLADVNNSVLIGYFSTPGSSSVTNAIVIGHEAEGIGSNGTVIGNSSTNTTKLYGVLDLQDDINDATGSVGSTGALLTAGASGVEWSSSSLNWNETNKQLYISSNSTTEPALLVNGSGGISMFKVGSTYSSPTGGQRSRFILENNEGGVLSVQYSNSKYGTSLNLQNTASFATTLDHNLRFSTNGSNSSGGTSKVTFSAGGFNVIPILEISSNPLRLAYVNGNLKLDEYFYDGTNSKGNPGDILTSTATGTQWLPTSALEFAVFDSITSSGNTLYFWKDGTATTVSISDTRVDLYESGVLKTTNAEQLIFNSTDFELSSTGSSNGNVTVTLDKDPVITLSGDASGSTTMTNLGSATLSVTVADDSHNHVISNIDGLQAALDTKLETEVDGSVTNELQTISWSAGTGGNDQITLSNGGGTITITDNVNDADADATNELISSVAISSNNLQITDAGGTKQVSLAPYLDNTDAQDLSLSGNTLSLTGDATTVDLAGYLDNTDDQKIDVLALVGTTLNLSLEGDGEATKTVNLSSLQDGTGTDDQNITGGSWNSTNGNLTIGIEDGNSQTINLDGRYLTSEVDGNISNEGLLDLVGLTTGAALVSNTSGSSTINFIEGNGIDITKSGYDVVISNTGLTQTSSFNGDVSGTYSNLQLKTGVVTSAEVADNSLTASDLQVNVVSSVDGVTNDGGNIDFVAGSNMTITPDNANDRITFTATDKTYFTDNLTATGSRTHNLSSQSFTHNNFGVFRFLNSTYNESTNFLISTRTSDNTTYNYMSVTPLNVKIQSYNKNYITVRENISIGHNANLTTTDADVWIRAEEDGFTVDASDINIETGYTLYRHNDGTNNSYLTMSTTAVELKYGSLENLPAFAIYNQSDLLETRLFADFYDGVSFHEEVEDNNQNVGTKNQVLSKKNDQVEWANVRPPVVIDTIRTDTFIVDFDNNTNGIFEIQIEPLDSTYIIVDQSGSRYESGINFTNYENGGVYRITFKSDPRYLVPGHGAYGSNRFYIQPGLFRALNGNTLDPWFIEGGESAYIECYYNGSYFVITTYQTF